MLGNDRPTLNSRLVEPESPSVTLAVGTIDTSGHTASVAFELMRTTGMLAITCPELLEGVGCEQNRWHAFDVWGHTMAVLDACGVTHRYHVGDIVHLR